jgi:hypothetical protein
MPTNAQDALASLRKWKLERDDTGPHRVYRDSRGNVYASVTHILSETSDKTGLVRWEQRLGPVEAQNQRQVAATRGNLAHSQAEYLLKTASALARNCANRKGSIKFDDQGLAHIPTPITRWALEKVHKNLPPVGWSAAGYARSLAHWITQHVTAIHAAEFSIHHPAGFAGTCDGLLDLKGLGLCVVDWKTSAAKKTLTPGHTYVHQLGAYSLGLQHLTGLRPQGGAVVLARRCGTPDVYTLNQDELVQAEDAYLARVQKYYAAKEGLLALA